MEQPPASGSAPPGRRLLRRRQRLPEAGFRHVFDDRKTLGGRLVVVFFRPNGGGVARLGLSVGRKHGGAVRRNRIKRVLREAFRLAQPALPPGYDYVLVPRQGVAAWTTAEARRDLQRLAERIGTRRV